MVLLRCTHFQASLKMEYTFTGVNHKPAPAPCWIGLNSSWVTGTASQIRRPLGLRWIRPASGHTKPSLSL